MKNAKIEEQHKNFIDIRDYLLKNKEITYAMDVGEIYKKNLLLSVTSYFETQIVTLIYDYAKKSSNADKRIADFIQRKFLARQCFQLFDWKAKNTNAFWTLFGEITKNKVRQEIDSESDLKKSEESFIKLFVERNNVVHNNFAEYAVNITMDEIYTLYQNACTFISLIEKVLDPSYVNNK